MVVAPSGCVNLTVAIAGRIVEPYATTASPSTVSAAAKMRCRSSAVTWLGLELILGLGLGLALALA